MRNFDLPVDCPDLVDELNFRRQSTMNAQYFVLDDCSERQVVKCLIAVFPWSWIPVLLHNLIVEAIDRGNLSWLVIAPQEDDFFGVFDFVAKQELDCFDWIVSSVHKVSDEDISGGWNFAAYLKKLHKIVELSVYVTTDSNRSPNVLDIRLFNQEFLDFVAQKPEVSLFETFACSEQTYPLVDVRHLN